MPGRVASTRSLRKPVTTTASADAGSSQAEQLPLEHAAAAQIEQALGQIFGHAAAAGCPGPPLRMMRLVWFFCDVHWS